MDYSRFLNDVAKRYGGSPLRKLFSLQEKEDEDERDILSVAGGLPNPGLFPLLSGTFEMRGGGQISITPELMAQALQYGDSRGYKPLLKKITSLTKRLHNPPCWSNTETLLTSGSQLGICELVESMINVGDYVIIEEPAYSGSIAVLQPYQPKWLPVATDSEGIRPDAMREVLSPWRPEDASHAVTGVPKFLYTNPVGTNPSGGVVSEARKREIYAIASSYNIIIIEDDPYYFINFSDDDEVIPSYLSMDTDGRVVRLDTFSKTVSPGMRVSYITGPEAIIEKLICRQQVSISHVSVLSQIVINGLLEQWGEEGFLSHCHTLKRFYRHQRDTIINMAHKHLKDECEWSVPAGGLFLWVKVNGVADTDDMVMKRARKKGVYMVPGNCFMTDHTKPSPYIRISFSIIPRERIEEAVERLAALIKEERQLVSAKDVANDNTTSCCGSSK